MRLIDADEAKKLFTELRMAIHDTGNVYGISGTIVESARPCVASGVRAAQANLKRMQTVDAVPVKHGKLIEGRYPNDFKCSECGQAFRDDIMWIYDIEDKGHQKFPPEYYPECGAKWSGYEFIDELEQKGGA